MKEIFQVFAVYNKAANKELISILENLQEAQIKGKTGAYYATIFDAYLHEFTTDFAWIKRFGGEHLKGSKLETFETHDIKKELENDYKKIFQYRKELDDVFVKLIESISEDGFKETLKFKNFKGEMKEFIVWKIFMQLFNHHTHHRGQISVFLDQIGVENDYSSMFGKI